MLGFYFLSSSFFCGFPCVVCTQLQGRILMPKAGLEPARIAPYAPQTYVSTNSTTSAKLQIATNQYCKEPCTATSSKQTTNYGCLGACGFASGFFAGVVVFTVLLVPGVAAGGVAAGVVAGGVVPGGVTGAGSVPAGGMVCDSGVTGC
jgi:hypothetical protein